MIGAVKVLAISEDNDVRSLIRSSLEFACQNAVCVSSRQQVLVLLNRGLEASFLLVHAKRDMSKDNLFAPSLLQNINSEKASS